MIQLFKKELSLFFSNLTGYLAIGVFLLLMGLCLFVFPESSLLSNGYASLDGFFDLAPWVLLLLVPAVTMRLFSDEFRQGTWELLRTRPLSTWQIVNGKLLAAVVVVLLGLLPSLLYVATLAWLSTSAPLDSGAIAGSYAGLLCLVAVFAAVGVLGSALTANPIVAFLIAAFCSFLMFSGFNAVSQIETLQGGADYWIDWLGLQSHYRSMSRGAIDLPDLLYFVIVTCFLIVATNRVLVKRK
jgi:ABC-2 type transport system permease protein